MPRICGDDRTIVFTSVVPGTPSINIWKIDRNGQGLQQITYGNEDIFPACSKDSKWIYYRDGRAQAIMKVSVDGGAPTKIASGFFSEIAQSVDGKLLAFLNAPEFKGGKYDFQIMFVATDGSPRQNRSMPTHVLDVKIVLLPDCCDSCPTGRGMRTEFLRIR
jgi:Tol biopolymer transport system component